MQDCDIHDGKIVRRRKIHADSYIYSSSWKNKVANWETAPYQLLFTQLIVYCHSLVLILILISIKTRIDNILGQNTTTPPHPTTGNSTLLDIAKTIDNSG